VRRRDIDKETTTAHNWYLTPYGSQQLQSRLELLISMLKASMSHRDPQSDSWRLNDIESENSQIAPPIREYQW